MERLHVHIRKLVMAGHKVRPRVPRVHPCRLLHSAALCAACHVMPKTSSAVTGISLGTHMSIA